MTASRAVFWASILHGGRSTLLLLQLSRAADLQDLARQPVVATKHRPRAAVGLGQRHLELGAQDLEGRFGRVDGRKQRHVAAVALGYRRVRRGQVELELLRLEHDLGLVLVDLLEEEGRND
jgi:hypothetical protein